MLPGRLDLFGGQGAFALAFRGEGRLPGHGEVALFYGKPMLGQNIRIGFTGFAQVGLERAFAIILLRVQCGHVELPLSLLHSLLCALFDLPGAIFHVQSAGILLVSR